FLSNRSATETPTRIQLLLDLIAGPGSKTDPFHTFFRIKAKLDDGATAQQVWEEIHDLYLRLRDWFEDRNLYHWIGFLIAVETGSSAALGALVNEARDSTKTEFRAGLCARIREQLDVEAGELVELEYDANYAKCTRLLLLFNVESVRTVAESFELYPFQ